MSRERQAERHGPANIQGQDICALLAKHLQVEPGVSWKASSSCTAFVVAFVTPLMLRAHSLRYIVLQTATSLHVSLHSVFNFFIYVKVIHMG